MHSTTHLGQQRPLCSIVRALETSSGWNLQLASARHRQHCHKATRSTLATAVMQDVRFLGLCCI